MATHTIPTKLYVDTQDSTHVTNDDHLQYHNDARGDARYYTKSQIDALPIGMTATEVSSATSITLTATSANIQAVTMTDIGMSVILPNATTLTAGHTFIIKNTGTNDLFIKDGSSAVKLRIQAQEIVIAYCTNITTVAGTWAFGDQSIGTDISLLFSKLFAEIAVTVNAVDSLYTSVTRLTDTQALVTYSGASGYLNTCTLNISGTTITAGSVLVVNINPLYILVSALSATQAVVIYRNNFNATLGSCTLNISGTTVTAGAMVTIDTKDLDNTSLAIMSSTQALVFYRDVSNGFGYARTLNISGTTITTGDRLTVNTTACSAHYSIDSLSNSQAILTYGDANSNNLLSRTLDISGTTVTAGAIATISALVCTLIKVCKLSSTQALVAFNNGSTNKMQICTLNISGTTVTAGAILNTNLDTGAFNVPTQVSATEALISYAASAGFLKAVMATVSGTTVTIGTPLDVNAVATSEGFIDMVSGGLAIVTYRGTSAYLQAQAIGIVK